MAAMLLPAPATAGVAQGRQLTGLSSWPPDICRRCLFLRLEQVFAKKTIERYAPVDMAHSAMYLSFLFSTYYAAYWGIQFTNAKCGTDNILFDPVSTCMIQAVGAVVFAMTSVESLLMIRNYDDRNQTILRKRREALRAMSMEMLINLRQTGKHLNDAVEKWSSCLEKGEWRDLSNVREMVTSIVKYLSPEIEDGISSATVLEMLPEAAWTDTRTLGDQICRGIEELFLRPIKLFNAKWPAHETPQISAEQAANVDVYEAFVADPEAKPLQDSDFDEFREKLGLRLNDQIAKMCKETLGQAERYAISAIWKPLRWKLDETQEQFDKWETLLRRTGMHLDVPVVDLLEGIELVKHNNAGEPWTYRVERLAMEGASSTSGPAGVAAAPQAVAMQQVSRTGASDLAEPLVEDGGVQLVRAPSPVPSSSTRQAVKSTLPAHGTLVEAIYSCELTKDGNPKLIWSADMPDGQVLDPKQELKNIPNLREAKVHLIGRNPRLSSNPLFRGFGVWGWPGSLATYPTTTTATPAGTQAPAPSRWFDCCLPRDLTGLFRVCAPECADQMPCCNPGPYPRTCLLPCWKLQVSTKLHERFLVTFLLALFFLVFYVATVTHLLVEGCPVKYTGLCAALVGRKIFGSIAFLLYLYSVWQCIRNIERLDELSEAMRETDAMNEKKNLVRDFKEKRLNIEGFMEVLECVQLSTGSVKSILKQYESLLTACERNAPKYMEHEQRKKLFFKPLAESLMTSLTFMKERIGTAEDAFKDGGKARLKAVCDEIEEVSQDFAEFRGKMAWSEVDTVVSDCMLKVRKRWNPEAAE